MVQAVLDRNATVDVQFKSAASSGQTALMGAAKGGHLGLVKFLVGAGATLELTDKQGMSALDYAVENGHDKIIAFLRSLKAPGQPVRKAKPAKPHPGEALVEAGRAVIASFAEAAAKPKFQRLLVQLEKASGTKPKAYANPEASEFRKLRGVFTVALPAEKLAEWQEKSATAGATLIEAEIDHETKVADCILFPTTDKSAIVLARETTSNGILEGDPEDILAFLMELDAQNPFRITVCAHDTIGGEFIEPLKRAKAWAKRMLAICPAEDDTEADPEDVAAMLKHERRFLLWWD
jgi:hypothetical protein